MQFCCSDSFWIFSHSISYRMGKYVKNGQKSVFQKLGSFAAKFQKHNPELLTSWKWRGMGRGRGEGGIWNSWVAHPWFKRQLIGSSQGFREKWFIHGISPSGRSEKLGASPVKIEFVDNDLLLIFKCFPGSLKSPIRKMKLPSSQLWFLETWWNPFLHTWQQ